ncbi:hypothetical protein [Yoonia sp. SS1-5]|uniref:Uncharacterized protein n=1 Tax=Yoonia rhodophyticola TaxID=3137370 RepID=A0AAN0NK09_9RHOB
MFNKKASTYTAAAAILAASFLPTISSASEISLTLKEQDITISGEFAGFQQDAYVLTTSAGELYVPAQYVTCEGEDCLIILSANTADN